jgi:hypothetical protein
MKRPRPSIEISTPAVTSLLVKASAEAGISTGRCHQTVVASIPCSGWLTSGGRAHDPIANKAGDAVA